MKNKFIIIINILLILCLFPACERKRQKALPTPVPTMTPIPHMEKILFTYKGDLFWSNTDGTGREEIFSDNNSKWFPSASPDGFYVAYWAKTKNSYNLWVGDFKTGRPYQLTFDEDTVEGDIQNFGIHNAPIWSTDSSFIIYSRNKELWKITRDGYNQEALTASHDCISPALSKDNKLVFSRIEKMNTYNLYIKDLYSLQDSPLTNLLNKIAASPAWSPAGNKIAFTVLDEDVSNIWSLDIGATQKLQLTFDGRSDSPCFSHDGNLIVFSSARNDKYQPELWTMNNDGSNQQRISNGGGVSPSWLYRVLENPLPTAVPTAPPVAQPIHKENVENVFAVKSSPVASSITAVAIPTRPETVVTMQPEATPEVIPENQLAVKAVKKGNYILFYPTIHFDSGSANIKEEYFAVLDEISKIIKKYKFSYIAVDGHTDNIPIHTKRYPSNYELSTARAKSVKNYLVVRHKLIDAKFILKGFGEKKPLKPNKSEEERFVNRRAEIKLKLITKTSPK